MGIFTRTIPAKDRYSEEKILLRPWPIAAATVAGIIVFVVLVQMISAVTSGYTRTSGGQVAVIRNGGPLDNNKVRQVIPPGSSRQWTGLHSQKHLYPAAQRFYTISATGNGDRSGVDVVRVQTKDGVDVGINGTMRFTLSLDGPTLEQFDNRYGTRTYTFRTIDADGKEHVKRVHPYDGEDGWSAFLDAQLRPVIDTALRQQVADNACAELVSSCALVQNGQNTQRVDPRKTNNNGQIIQVQQEINRTLQTDLDTQLGGHYVVVGSGSPGDTSGFTISGVALPENVQNSINNAQAAFADVSKAQAGAQAAEQDAQANTNRQRGYLACPTCAEIDARKAIPPGISVWAPGGNASVAVPSK